MACIRGDGAVYVTATFCGQDGGPSLPDVPTCPGSVASITATTPCEAARLHAWPTGIALADDGMHIDAVDQFHRAAGTLPDAAFGRCYLLGLGVPACPTPRCTGSPAPLAAATSTRRSCWHRSRCRASAPTSPLGLFEATTHYIGRPPDYQAALHWAREAAATGSAEAQTLLGYILTAGPEALRDARQGAANYRLAAEQGSAQGQLGWALALLRDDAGAPDASVPDAGAPDASLPDAGVPDATNAGSGNPDNRQPGAATGTHARKPTKC